MPSHEFRLTPSKQFILLISITLLSSLIIILTLPANLWIKCFLILILFVYGYSLFYEHGLLKGRQSITAIKYHQGSFHIMQDNQMIAATLLGDSTATGFVCILRFRVINRIRPHSCVIFRDSLPPHRYRQLLVILKM